MRAGHPYHGIAFLDAVGLVRLCNAGRRRGYVSWEQVNGGGMFHMTVRIIRVPRLLSGLVRMVMSIFGYRP